LAYRVAKDNCIPGGVNRVILGTHGDFNVGVTGADLIRLIEKNRDTGPHSAGLRREQERHRQSGGAGSMSWIDLSV
jgi:hypothetical protein